MGGPHRLTTSHRIRETPLASPVTSPSVHRTPTHPSPGEAAAAGPQDITFFIPANNPIEADHGQLKRRLRPMRGLQTDWSAQVVIAGHAFVQNLRRGQYDIALDNPPATRLAAAFGELARAI